MPTAGVVCLEMRLRCKCKDILNEKKMKSRKANKYKCTFLGTRDLEMYLNFVCSQIKVIRGYQKESRELRSDGI